MLNRNVIQRDTGNIPRHGLAASVDSLPNNTGDVSHSPKRGLHFLHFACLDREVVRRQDAINERLFFLPLKCYLDFLIHQKVRPVLTNLFRHAEACTIALCPLMSVISPVLMEPLDFADVPRLPKGHVCIEFLWDCRIPEFL